MVTFCLACEGKDTELPSRPPVARLSLRERAVFVELSPGVDLQSAVDLSLFNGVTPEMSVDEAQRLLGRPPRKEALFNSPAFAFETSSGRIVFAKRTIASEDTHMEKWELYAFPRNPTPNGLIAAAVLGQIPSLTEAEDISVVMDNEGGTAHISLAKGKVQWVYWGRRLQPSTPLRFPKGIPDK